MTSGYLILSVIRGSFYSDEAAGSAGASDEAAGSDGASDEAAGAASSPLEGGVGALTRPAAPAGLLCAPPLHTE